MYSFDLRPLFLFFAIIGALFITGAWILTSWIVGDEIRSNRPIAPRLELVIEDNKVDTVYVYDNLEEE